MGGAMRSVDTARASNSAARPHRFTKEMRLRKRREFLAVQQTGRKFHGRHFLAVIAPSSSTAPHPQHGRVGITVTKKIGNAVTRNRIKRLVREYLRQSAWMPAGFDAVIIAKHSAATLDGFHQVAADLAQVGARITASARARGGPGSEGQSPLC